MSRRSEREVGANVIVLLIEQGVIGDRYTDHQLAIYTGVPRQEIERARKRFANAATREDMRPHDEAPAARSTGEPERVRRPREEVERDLYVAAHKRGPFRMMAAYFTALDDHPFIGEMCPVCEEPIEVGQHVRIEGLAAHAGCGS